MNNPYAEQAAPDPDDYKSIAYHNFINKFVQADLDRKKEKGE